MRRLIAATLVALLSAACAPVDSHRQSAEQMDTGHVDTGGAGGGSM